MEIIELVKKLRNCGGGPEGIRLANQAADKIEWLQKLTDDSTNDHFVDTLDFYSERCQKLEEDFMELVMKSPEICTYCKYNFECKGKECAGYIEGRGCTDEMGNHYDWKWSCIDFNHGECPMLEMLPCNGCFANNNKGFEWRGNDV